MDAFSDQFIGAAGASQSEVLRILGRAVEIGVNFKCRDRFFDPAVAASPSEVMSEPIPLEGISLDSIFDELELRYLPGITNLGSRRFLGFPDAGNAVAGIAGAILSDLINVNLINSTFCSRLATEMEIAVIRWMRKVLGYPEVVSPQSAAEVGGAILAGGTMANFMSLLLARERAFPHTMRNGTTFDPRQIRVIVPERTGHYSMSASLAWAGLGSENIVRCPIKEFRYDQKALKELLLNLQDSGLHPIMLTAYAGDSRTMTIDDLQGVHDVVRSIDRSIWLHCDGCHGVSLCFSGTHKQKVKGIELWDSVSFDPHKVLTLPYPLSMLLLRDPQDTRLIVTESELIMRQQNSLGQTTPVLGSKPFWSFRLWMLFKALGLTGIGKIIDDRIVQAKRFAELVSSMERFVLMNNTDINSIMFIYIPPGLTPPLSGREARRISKLNRAIYDRLLAEGEYYLHSFIATDNLNRLGLGDDFGVDVLRFMVGNPLANSETFAGALEYIIELGRELGLNLEDDGDEKKQ